MKMKTTMRGAACALVLAGLGACGGGGGGSGDRDEAAATGDLTAENYAASTDAAYATVELSSELSAMMSETVQAQSVPASRSAALTPVGVQRLVLDRVRQGSHEQAQAAEPVTQPCDGGGSLSITESGFDDGISRGDKITVVANGCKESADDLPMTGSLTATVTAASETSTSASFSLAFQFSAFGSSELRFNGGVNISATGTDSESRVSIDYNGLTVTSAAGTQQWRHTVVEQSANGGTKLKLGGLVQVTGDFYRLEQVADFSVSGTHLVSGSLRLVDRQGDYALITGGAEALSYSFFPAGSSAPTGSPVTRPHSSLQ